MLVVFSWVFVEPVGDMLSNCATPVTEYAPAAANAAPDRVPAGICTAPAPVTVNAPAAAYAAPAPVSDYVDPSSLASATRAEATFKISGADGGGDAGLLAEVQPVVDAVVPESTDVTERWEDADVSESMTEMKRGRRGDQPGLELDVVFDVLSELSGEDGGDCVRVHRVQALTSLRLWRLEELLEDWESMGGLRRDDTRLWVTFCPSVGDALNDEECWWKRGQGFRPEIEKCSQIEVSH